MKQEEINRHSNVANGYMHVYKAFERLVHKYEQKNDVENALLYKRIANRFKEIHEKYLETIDRIRGIK